MILRFLLRLNHLTILWLWFLCLWHCYCNNRRNYFRYLYQFLFFSRYSGRKFRIDINSLVKEEEIRFSNIDSENGWELLEGAENPVPDATVPDATETDATETDVTETDFPLFWP